MDVQFVLEYGFGLSAETEGHYEFGVGRFDVEYVLGIDGEIWV
jgi:hypothetical protein